MRIKTLIIISAAVILTASLLGARTYADKSDSTQDKIVSGTDKSDSIETGPGDDNIHTGPGNDRVISGAGDDLVSTGPGNDKIKDGPGDDYIIGGEGNDTVVLGSGNDFVNLGPGDDTLVINLKEDIGDLNYADGGEGNDTVIFVTDDADGIINNEILQYYEKEKVYGKKIVDMGGLNVAAGLSGFEQVGVAASYSF